MEKSNTDDGIALESEPTVDSLKITRLDLWAYSAIDLGWLIKDDESADYFLHARGRPDWLKSLFDRLLESPKGFKSPEIANSAYGQTDRYGRCTFSRQFSDYHMPITFFSEHQAKRIVGVLQWSALALRLGSTGSFSITFHAELRPDVNQTTVKQVAQDFHAIRREFELQRAEILENFIKVWSAAIPECKAVFPNNIDLNRYFHTYDAIDFDYLVNGTFIPPKTIYTNSHANIVRALAGLTRMSLVMESYDETSVRRLGKFDIGSRWDELWIANEERLLRHHPDNLKNAYVDAFFEDVLLGIELLIQQEATLCYLAKWLGESRIQFLDKLIDSEKSDESFETMRRLLVQMAWASDLFTDPIIVEDNSGHSFFRRIMSRITELKVLDRRRDDVSSSFQLLLNLSQSMFSQSSEESSKTMQRVSLEIAESSKRLARYTYVLTAMAVLIAAIQLFGSITDSEFIKGMLETEYIKNLLD